MTHTHEGEGEAVSKGRVYPEEWSGGIHVYCDQRCGRLVAIPATLYEHGDKATCKHCIAAALSRTTKGGE